MLSICGNLMGEKFLFLLLKNAYLLQHALFASYMALPVLFFTSVPSVQPLNEEIVMSKVQTACVHMSTSLCGLLLIHVTASKTVCLTMPIYLMY